MREIGKQFMLTQSHNIISALDIYLFFICLPYTLFLFYCSFIVHRILLIQNAPEKIHPPPSPVLIVRHHNLPQNNMMGSAANGNNAPSNYNNRSIAQNQCVANIENNPMNYERDWPLDDSSQSSFKPCPQGSGSMIPLSFHDSAHTMYEPEVEKIRHQQVCKRLILLLFSMAIKRLLFVWFFSLICN